MVAPFHAGRCRLRLQPVEPTTRRSGRAGAGPVTFATTRCTLSLASRSSEVQPVVLRMFTTSDGLRRFYPWPEDGFYGLIERAFPLGLALLAQQHGFDVDTIGDYRAGKVAYDNLQRVQEVIKTRLASPDMLTVRKCHRATIGRAYLVPSCLRTPTPTPTKLLQLGAEAADAAGWSHVPGRRLHYALSAAALENPLSLPPADVPPLLRMALFDLTSVSEAISAEHTTIVRRTFREHVLRRLRDDPEKLSRRLSGGNTNLLQVLARRKDSAGRRLGREVAKRGMHDFGWDGYALVAECLEAFAQAFAAALPQPLDDWEREHFGATFYRQAHLGGLSLALIGRRGRLLQPTLERLWERPGDPLLIGTLHRVLAGFAEIVPLAREIERLKKRPSQRCVDLARTDESQLFRCGVGTAELLTEALAKRGSVCRRCGRPLIGELVPGSVRPGQSLRVAPFCEEHGAHDAVELSWESFVDAADVFVK